MAAHNIRGKTIHSALHLTTAIRMPYQPLSESMLNTLRSQLRNCQIVIIDEIPMVTQPMLEYIHGRLVQVQDDGSLTENLWSKFQKWELTEVVRQKDTTFIDLLNYVRKRKKSTPFSPLHLATLRSRCVKAPDDNIIRIYPTNKQTSAYNYKMLQTTKNPIITITAVDTIATRIGDRILTAPLKTVKSQLPPEIHLSVGARVILTFNVDVENGLSNGARGTVTNIDSSKHFHGLPTFVHVKFDDVSIGSKYQIGFPYAESLDVPIHFQSEMLPSRSIMRHQYPL
ncbi:hypothetical protein QYM36_018590 [Artemia franciscana]|uniref:DNA helicase Pif1-like 2B domain-containing protein n=1 Tax=Artemia franciscana TaxID=6661 RepID=A0AA88H6I9_ARTSF|nr:hypothetical protein QYM36_018590 [Artemia franciscana]